MNKIEAVYAQAYCGAVELAGLVDRIRKHPVGGVVFRAVMVFAMWEAMRAVDGVVGQSTIPGVTLAQDGGCVPGAVWQYRDQAAGLTNEPIGACLLKVDGGYDLRVSGPSNILMGVQLEPGVNLGQPGLYLTISDKDILWSPSLASSRLAVMDTGGDGVVVQLRSPETGFDNVVAGGVSRPTVGVGDVEVLDTWSEAGRAFVTVASVLGGGYLAWSTGLVRRVAEGGMFWTAGLVRNVFEQKPERRKRNPKVSKPALEESSDRLSRKDRVEARMAASQFLDTGELPEGISQRVERRARELAAGVRESGLSGTFDWFKKRQRRDPTEKEVEEVEREGHQIMGSVTRRSGRIMGALWGRRS